MNKKTTPILLLLLWMVTATFAQQLPRKVVASGGGHAQAGNVQLSWTAGQAVSTQNIAPAAFYITQGYEQGDELWVKLNAQKLAANEVTIYPNPTYGTVHLTGKVPSANECSVMLYDMSGHECFKSTLQPDGSGALDTELQFSELSAGNYVFCLQGQKGDQPFVLNQKIVILK